MKPLTIFTPTYNRAYCLHHCYESLKRQTSKQFIWLIIDDGSTDGTEKIVKRWMEESVIQIEYRWQENQGMHGAHNTAYAHIETELNVCVDSDDYMPDDAVERILNFWQANGSDCVSGIVGLNSYTNNKIIGTTLPVNLKTAKLFDLYNKYKVKGDKKLVYRTELTRNYEYPLFQNEKYVGLDYKYYQLDKKYDLLLMNKVLCKVEYLPDGSSRNMVSQYYHNPQGFSFYRKQLMKLPFANGIFKFRQSIHYVSSSLLCRNWRLLKDTPQKGLTLLALPLGVILFLYIKLRVVMKTRLVV